MRMEKYGLLIMDHHLQEINVLVSMKVVKFGHHTMVHLLQEIDVSVFMRAVKLVAALQLYSYYYNLNSLK